MLFWQYNIFKLITYIDNLYIFQFKSTRQSTLQHLGTSLLHMLCYRILLQGLLPVPVPRCQRPVWTHTIWLAQLIILGSKLSKLPRKTGSFPTDHCSALRGTSPRNLYNKRRDSFRTTSRICCATFYP